jgi:GNAT superfamily N-acetyltransferase
MANAKQGGAVFLKIRKIKKGEEKQICRMILDVFDEFIAPDYCVEGIKEFRQYVNPELITQRLQINCLIYVAEVENNIAGVLELRDNNHISLLFVKKQYQNQGIAKELVGKATAVCIKNNGGKLEVNSSPYAVNIYKRLGFITTDWEKTVDGIRFTAMEKKIE